jgi:uncharacterized membrane protein YraQ (UPF0718 family)
LRLALDQFVTVMPRVIMAVVTATFLGALMPENMIASWLGAETGIAGILVAAVAGGLVPGGPVLSYPLAVVLMQTGAGVPQLTAFLAAWSVFAMHRMISYEIPLMGWRFSAVRLLASLALPLAAGLLAGLLVTATGLKKAPTPPDSIRAARLAVMDLRDADPSITRDRRVDGRQR